MPVHPINQADTSDLCGERELISEVALKSLTSLGSHNFCVINSAGSLMLWNKRVEETSQMSAEELLVCHVTDVFRPRDHDLLLRKMQEVLQRDAEVQLEADLVAKDGHATPYLFSASRFACEGKYYIFCMGMDISRRRADEKALRLRDRALHATSNGIVITRCDGVNNPIEYVNPAFEQITGYTAAEAIGLDSRFMAAPGLDEVERGQLREAIRERREINVVFRNRRKNGELFWNDLAITPVRAESGEVTHFIGVINDVTALKQRTSHLEHEVNHDPLTGLANRNLLWDRLEQALHTAQRNKTLVAIILVDLNKFKQINDTLGHEAGDEVLKMAARRLQSAVRESDTVARLSGDEFVLVLADQPSLRFTLRMVDRLCAAMGKPMVFDGKDIAVGASMGVSIFPHDGVTAFDLVRAADVAMYHAKTSTDKEVHFFSADMRSSTEARQKLECDMRHALADNELFMLYQPKWSLRSGAVVGVEALLRWRHPELGVLLPTAFLGDAEENGLIVPLGRWALEHACAALQRLAALGHGELPLSVNASYREFIQDNYIANVGNTLRKYGIAPRNFELELREEHLTRNPHLCREVALAARDLGIRLAVDDFGAGASNLVYLQSMPIQHLKLTRASIREIGSQAGTGKQLAKTLIDIAHNMSIEVIAEGVETEAQRDLLIAYGCDQAQGHIFSAPLTQPALEHLLAAAPGHGAMRS
ncbi:putative bifunctional diguanylate cyclase/phosphodiesterase [Pseudoduganella namucuonensis]|uniref:PAS domain S-box-containing protein/diguanylate cyclase (GGDEF) domain-containing protein n=1 Tax=Pseudoduganella namucuonensis TaxID=1035707 RepID=A0A1I7LB57_9BURK|nr:bifunctional diguanylate cyclase/phosphodiesterase [Pseudoduganella namucuonensis]SFV06957.1 PAS domain S-box-containing protein/diguanylate cyclase (GGDEF) domain-containing protein [Pseudoduganella namucuonensis]